MAGQQSNAAREFKRVQAFFQEYFRPEGERLPFDKDLWDGPREDGLERAHRKFTTRDKQDLLDGRASLIVRLPELTRCLIWDIDIRQCLIWGIDIRRAIKRILKAGWDDDLVFYVCPSTSGDGYHLYLFLTDALPQAEARRLALALGKRYAIPADVTYPSGDQGISAPFRKGKPLETYQTFEKPPEIQKSLFPDTPAKEIPPEIKLPACNTTRHVLKKAGIHAALDSSFVTEQASSAQLPLDTDRGKTQGKGKQPRQRNPQAVTSGKDSLTPLPPKEQQRLERMRETHAKDRKAYRKFKPAEASKRRSSAADHLPGDIVDTLKSCKDLNAYRAALIGRWPKGPCYRQRLALCAGVDLFRHGATEREALEIVEAACKASGDTETASRLRAVRSAYKRIREGGSAAGAASSSANITTFPATAWGPDLRELAPKDRTPEARRRVLLALEGIPIGVDGVRIHSTRTLAERTGCSRHVCWEVLKELALEGVLQIDKGRGSIPLSGPPQAPTSPYKSPPAGDYAHHRSKPFKRLSGDRRTPT